MRGKDGYFKRVAFFFLFLPVYLFLYSGIGLCYEPPRLTPVFNQFEANCQKDDYGAALSALKKIETWKLDQGLRNAPSVSEALMRVYEHSPLYEENSNLQRLSIYTGICALSPDEPKFQWALLKQYILAKPFDIYHIFKKAHNFRRAIQTNLGWTLAWEGKLIFALFLALFFSVFYFAVILVLKYSSYLVFYMRRFLSFPINKFLAIMLVLIVFMLPVYFNIGFVWLPLFCMVLMWLLLTKQEKGVVFLFAVIFLLISLGVTNVGKIFSAIGNRKANLIYLANYSQFDPVSLKRLEKATTGYKGNADILFTLGLVAKRRGDYKRAEKYYLAAINQNKNFAVCMNNLGNVYLLSKHFGPNHVERARTWYKKAIKINPTRAEFFYNLSKSFPLLQVEGMEYIVKARDLNPLLIDTLTKQASNSPNQRLVDCLLPANRIWRRALSNSRMTEKVTLLFWRFFFNTPWDNPYMMPIVLFFIIFVFALFQRRVQLATSCENCGQLFFRPIPIRYSQQLCHQCQMLRKRSEQADPEVVKQKELEVARFQRRKKLITFIVGFFPAGGGFFLKGQALLGALLALVFYYFLSYFLVSHQLLPNLALWLYGFASPSYLPLILACIFYLAGLVYFLLNFSRGEI